MKWSEDGQMKRIWRNSCQWCEKKRPWVILSPFFCLPLRTVSAPEARLDWSYTALRGIRGKAGSPEGLASSASSPFLPSKREDLEESLAIWQVSGVHHLVLHQKTHFHRLHASSCHLYHQYPPYDQSGNRFWVAHGVHRICAFQGIYLT